jgi:hypothetical protein
MRRLLPAHIVADMPMLVVVAGVIMALPGGNAMADNLLGAYVGGAVGQARVDTTAPYVGGAPRHGLACLVGAAPSPVRA